MYSNKYRFATINKLHQVKQINNKWLLSIVAPRKRSQIKHIKLTKASLMNRKSYRDNGQTQSEYLKLIPVTKIKLNRL